jgi:hypothetical protein
VANAANCLRRCIAAGEFKNTGKVLGLKDLCMLDFCQRIINHIWGKIRMTEEKREKFNI